MNKILPILLALLFFSCDEEVIAPTIFGCTDSMACNYSPEANQDDNSCMFAEENFDCAGNCLLEFDE